VSQRKLTLISILVLVLSVGVGGIVQADSPVLDGDPPDGSSLNETLSFNNLGTIMSDRNDGDEADGTDDGTDGEEPDDEGDDPEGREEGVDDDLGQHPVASALADFFFAEMLDEMTYEDVNALYDEIMALHEAGNGFGTITKAYFFAGKFDPPLTPQELLEEAHGTGWGNVLKEGGIHPGAVGNGAANSNRPDHAGRPDSDNPAKDGPPGQLKKEDQTGGRHAGSTNLVGPGGNNGNNGRHSGNSDNKGNGPGNSKGVNGRPDDDEGDPGNNGNNGNNGNGRGNGRNNGRGHK
jgi:hypothetical protein